MTRGPKKPLVSITVDEAMQARSASHYAYQAVADVEREWDEALADETLTIAEVKRLREKSRFALEKAAKAFTETSEVVPYTEEVCQRVLVGYQWSVYGEVSDHAIANAATIGIEPPTAA